MKHLTPPPNPSPMSPGSAGRGDDTREALIRAATEIFARDGYHAAGTRALAEAAGAGQALISYHFGGKRGLYLAVFESLLTQLEARHGHVAAVVGEALAQPCEALDAEARRARFLPLLLTVCEGFLTMLMEKETEAWSLLILREQQQPTEAFARLYRGFVGRMLDLMMQLVQRLRHETDDRRARTIVVGLLGHILVWRVSRAMVCLHLGWTAFGAEERAQARLALRRAVIARVFHLPAAPVPLMCE